MQIQFLAGPQDDCSALLQENRPEASMMGGEEQDIEEEQKPRSLSRKEPVVSN